MVSVHSSIMKLSNDEIADIFLGKLKVLNGSTGVAPLDQAEGSAERAAFYLKFTGKSQAQLKAFWSKVIFTGRGRPPRMLANDAEVIRALQEDSRAIGYVERNSADATVRILR